MNLTLRLCSFDLTSTGGVWSNCFCCSFLVDSNGNDIIFNWLTAFFFHFLQVNPGWGLLPTSNPWFTRVITVIYPWYNRDLYPKPWFGTVSVQNRDFLQPMIYPWYNHDLPVIARVLKHGFEPPNCVDFFTLLYHILLKEKHGCAERSDRWDRAVPSKEQNISAHYFNIPRGSSRTTASYNLK